MRSASCTPMLMRGSECPATIGKRQKTIRAEPQIVEILAKSRPFRPGIIQSAAAAAGSPAAAQEPAQQATANRRFLVLHDRPLSSKGDSRRDRDVNLNRNG